MKDHKHDESIKEELEITDINVMKVPKKWLQSL
jgi:hypothetical protein